MSPERDRLEQDFAAAVQLVGETRVKLERFVGRRETSPYFEAFSRAKAMARKANNALDAHRNQHGR